MKDGSGLAIASAFSDRVQVFISDSDATLTLLRVNRLEDIEYRFRVQNTDLESIESFVSVFVQCKYKINLFFLILCI